jgi:hypothetical protein
MTSAIIFIHLCPGTVYLHTQISMRLLRCQIFYIFCYQVQDHLFDICCFPHLKLIHNVHLKFAYTIVASSECITNLKNCFSIETCMSKIYSCSATVTILRTFQRSSIFPTFVTYAYITFYLIQSSDS